LPVARDLLIEKTSGGRARAGSPEPESWNQSLARQHLGVPAAETMVGRPLADFL
jgi:hypothetical protein